MGTEAIPPPWYSTGTVLTVHGGAILAGSQLAGASGGSGRPNAPGAAAGGRVGFGGDAGGGLLAQADLAAEAGQVLVAGLGLKLRSGAAVGAQAPGPPLVDKAR